jgi:hypothetical protein
LQSVIPDNRLQAVRTRLLEEIKATRKRINPVHHPLFNLTMHLLDDLRKEMRNCFVDLNHKEAFDLLYKEAWHPEEAAMGNSNLPTVLNKLCMVANIITRKLIEIIKAEIKLKHTKIEDGND